MSSCLFCSFVSVVILCLFGFCLHPFGHFVSFLSSLGDFSTSDFDPFVSLWFLFVLLVILLFSERL